MSFLTLDSMIKIIAGSLLILQY